MEMFVIALVASAPALAATLLLMGVAVRVNKKVAVIADVVEAVHKEIKTINAQSIAQLADADETRRIEEKEVGDRSSIERSHMRSVEQEREENGQ